MAITLTTRKTPRQALATLLGQISTFVATYDHESPDFGGQSPVATVHSDGTRTEFPDYAREFHRFWISLYWRRADSDDIEDRMDDLATDVRQKLNDNADTADWEDLRFDGQFSEMDYVLIDGEMYRRERLRVTAFVVP